MRALLIGVLMACSTSPSSPSAPGERPSIPIEGGDAFAQVSTCLPNWSHEEPRGHVDGFRIEAHPVSCAEWDACVAAGKCRRRPLEECQDATMLVSLNRAEEFCKWHGARLPTLLEWSRAARGGTKILQRDPSQPCTEVRDRRGERQQRCAYRGPSGMRFTLTTNGASEWTSDTNCIQPNDGHAHPVAVGLGEDETALRQSSASVAAFRCARSGLAQSR